MSTFKKWWLHRRSVIDTAFGVAFSGVYLRFLVLDYGIRFSVRLPYIWDNFNPINWLTKGLFRMVLRLCRVPDSVSFCKYWKFSQHKGLELEVANAYAIAALEYH